MSSKNTEFPCGSCVSTCDAAREGHLMCLQFACESGIPWQSATTFWAARDGHLEVLQFAHEQNKIWDRDTTLTAARYNELQCLKYIYEQCGNEIGWDDTKLRDFEQDECIPEEIKEYLRTVENNWKKGLNIFSNVKPAR